jgi:hypothetical protein
MCLCGVVGVRVLGCEWMSGESVCGVRVVRVTDSAGASVFCQARAMRVLPSVLDDVPALRLLNVIISRLPNSKCALSCRLIV